MELSLFAITLVILTSIGNGIGSIFFKKAAMQNKKLLELIFDIRFLTGLFIYGAAAILYVIALKYGEISVLYPIAAMQYVWVLIFAVIIFKEKVNMLKWIGVGLILAGVLFIGFGL